MREREQIFKDHPPVSLLLELLVPSYNLARCGYLGRSGHEKDSSSEHVLQVFPLSYPLSFRVAVSSPENIHPLSSQASHSPDLSFSESTLSFPAWACPCLSWC